MTFKTQQGLNALGLLGVVRFDWSQREVSPAAGVTPAGTLTLTPWPFRIEIQFTREEIEEAMRDGKIAWRADRIAGKAP